MVMNKNTSCDRPSSRGFSLVELMIVMAIGSLLILGLAQISGYQARVSRTGELDKQLDDIKRQFQSWIFNQSFCDATFRGLRNGDPAQGIRRSIVDPTDFIIQNGERIPGSDWTVESFTLLNRAEILRDYPQYGAGVNADGQGTGVLRVVLKQLQRGTLNTQIADGQDTGAFKSTRKELYFPIAAKFGKLVQITAFEPPVGAMKSSMGPPNGMCCATCTQPGEGTQTYLQVATGELVTATQTVALTAGSPPNPIEFRSSADAPNPEPSPFPSPIAGGVIVNYYNVECWVYNLDYAIIKCVSPDSGSL